MMKKYKSEEYGTMLETYKKGTLYVEIICSNGFVPIPIQDLTIQTIQNFLKLHITIPAITSEPLYKILKLEYEKRK